jgi:hypothetical protein
LWGERKERKNTNNWSLVAIQLLSVHTRHTMWKREWLSIQGDGGWPDLDTEWCHTHHLNGADAAHSLVRVEHTPTTFRLKIKNKKWKYQNASMVLLFSQNIHVKIPKYPQRQIVFFLVFSEDKNVILLYIKIEKTWNTLVQRPIFFWSWRQINIFTVMNIVKSQEISWSTILNFVDLKGKRVFLLCKKI